jgi:hypothetical protein
MNVSSLYVVADADTHGALDSSRIGVFRRTVGLWLLMMAQRMLRSRIDIRFRAQ